MAYGFVTQSGGQIDIDSAPNAGTTVNILLPRAAVLHRQKPVNKTVSATGGSETILVVDDEQDIVDNVAAILREAGYRVLTAASADEAVTRLDGQGRIDLLFTDVIMPGAVSATDLAARASAASEFAGALYLGLHGKRLDPQRTAGRRDYTWR